MKIKYKRQYDKAVFEAETSTDISKQYQEHYELYVKLKGKPLTNEDGKRFNELEEEILNAIKRKTIKPAFVGNDEKITVICID